MAVADHDAALALAREISYRPEQARAHDGLAHVHRDLGQIDLAHDHALQALDLYTALDVPEADEIRTFLSDLYQLRHTARHARVPPRFRLVAAPERLA